MILFTVVNKAIFNHSFRIATGTSGQKGKHGEGLDCYAYIIGKGGLSVMGERSHIP
ncbi:hypothetical protein BH23CYA1_BH23CYA1_17960 [soil metagenome]